MGGGNGKELPIISHRYTNAFFDISEIIEWMGATRAPSRYELAKLIIEMNPDKVIMGSDFPWYDIKTTVDKVLDLPLLNDGHKASILGRNAKQILGV
jgi:predicted TIM-barrel fold metal-dependent hydrolase